MSFHIVIKGKMQNGEKTKNIQQSYTSLDVKNH